jgi:cyclophilin family peptidyl-prolyl cis-trans isomerase
MEGNRHMDKSAAVNMRQPRPLLYGYAVFGQVAEGMEVVDAIRQVKTGNKGGQGDVPLETVFIRSIKVIE